LEVVGLVCKDDVFNVPFRGEGSIVNSMFHVKLSIDIEEEEWSQGKVVTGGV